MSAFVGATIGLVLGVASAYFGGRFDLIFQRVMDVLMAFPLIILALAVVSIFGTGTQNVILAITIPFIPRCARVVRSSALAVRETPYIDAARACGFSHTRIVLRHMVPNVMAPYLIMMTAAVGQAILIEASLSFLGLGVQEPVPAWGLMLQRRRAGICRERAVGRDLPGHRHLARRVRLQPVRRRAARLARPEDEGVTHGALTAHHVRGIHLIILPWRRGSLKSAANSAGMTTSRVALLFVALTSRSG